MKTKKALETTIMPIIIIVLVVLFLIGGITFAWIKGMNKNSDIERCRLTVITASKVKTGGETISIDCPRRDINFELKDSEVDGKPSEDALKRKIAEEMKTCWYKMSGEQQLNPYAESKNLWNALTEQGTNVCLVCSEISFDPEIQEKFPLLNDFNGFLIREGYSNYFVKETTRYSFTSFLIYYYRTDEKISTTQMSGQAKESLSTKKDYYLIYSTFSYNYLRSRNWLTAILTPTQGVDSFSVMHLIASNEIEGLGCSTLKG